MGDVLRFERRLPPGRAADFFRHIETFAQRDPEDARDGLRIAVDMASRAGWPETLIEREVRRLLREIDQVAAPTLAHMEART